MAEAKPEPKHEHQWVPSHAAMLTEGYPDFVVRYVCGAEGCPGEDGNKYPELIEIVEGSEV